MNFNSDILKPIIAIVVITLAFFVIKLGLFPSVLLGTCVYASITGLRGFLENKGVKFANVCSALAIWVALVAFFGIMWMTGHYLVGPEGLSGMLLKLSSIIEEFRDLLPVAWQAYLPEGADQLKALISEHLKAHAQAITQTSMHGLHLTAQLVMAIVIATMLATDTHTDASGNIVAYFKQHIENFKEGVVKVFGAQAIVAALNAVVTGIYILIVLPLLDIHLPFGIVAVLLTFVFGLIPVVGNLMSNTLNILLSLSVAPWVGILSLVFLVVSHKLEYLLAAKFVGAKVGAKAWELLTVMILMEASFGPIGFAVAPVLYAWLKIELRKHHFMQDSCSK